jgi:hypothetical protein
MRDVGGLAVEMARRDDWRYALLQARCAEVLGLEERIHELDALMATSEIAAQGFGAVQCKCLRARRRRRWRAPTAASRFPQR